MNFSWAATDPIITVHIKLLLLLSARRCPHVDLNPLWCVDPHYVNNLVVLSVAASLGSWAASAVVLDAALTSDWRKMTFLALYSQHRFLARKRKAVLTAVGGANRLCVSVAAALHVFCAGLVPCWHTR